MKNHPLTFSPPPLSRIQKALFLQKTWFDPVFIGLENVDRAKPALYVGNHTLYGTLDGPLMILGLYEHKDIFLRSLGDHIHFQVPLWRKLLIDGGCVEGTPENCQQLMQAKGMSASDAAVVASGRSSRHVMAIADHLARRLKEEGYGTRPVSGAPQGDWVLVDAGDVIVHVFRPEVRDYYDLEGMWSVQ